MRIAVLFDGAGLARLGLERAGHDCVGFELDPWKHYLGSFVGSGRTVLADVKDVELSGFDAVWASPPCQLLSSARTQGPPISEFSQDHLDWSLNLPHEILWVENVIPQGRLATWGKPYNAGQFLDIPIQNRNRMIGGKFREPVVFRPYAKVIQDKEGKQLCPAITATEYKGCASDKRRASRYYGRRLTLDECAYHQGFDVPLAWREVPSSWSGTKGEWLYNCYEAIGNGVPVFMAEAFGNQYR